MKKEIRKWPITYLGRKSDLILFDDLTVETKFFGMPREFTVDKLLTNSYGFADNKAIEMEIVAEMLYLIPMEQYSEKMKLLAQFYTAYKNPSKWYNKHVRPDQLFFTGTQDHTLSFEEKIEKRKGIVACVSPEFTIKDAFKIFDLRKASWRRDVKNDSGGEDYLYIKDGYIVYGGYDRTGNGGENYHDAESMYYCSEESFDIITNRRYQGVQKELKMFLEGYAV